MIVGTAGHIDHGKTSLIKALTGTDTDRLKEEKARGITIELGFAYLPRPTGVMGFVDVPGHERFVHTMLAGAHGIDFVLLVIAADDGVMPQTREHLDILDLLGLAHGCVVLSKSDLVDADTLLLRELEIGEALRGTALEGSRVLPVSTVTGKGIEALLALLDAEAAALGARDDSRAFRLAVDRSFTLSGAGTIVTGTILDGVASVGDAVLLSPSGLEARIRSIHAQNRATQTAGAGARAALNLAGTSISKENAHRGDMVVAPSLHAPTARIDAELRVLPSEKKPPGQWMPVRLHHATAEVGARLVHLGTPPVPGQVGDVQLILEEPIAASALDRFILRDVSQTRTIGGGRFLDLRAPQRKRATPERARIRDVLRQSDSAAVLGGLLATPPHLVPLPAFLADRCLRAEQGGELASHLGLTTLRVDGIEHVASAEFFAGLLARLAAALGAFHAANRDLAGMSAQALRRQEAAYLGPPLFTAVLRRFHEAGALVMEGTMVRLPGHSIALSPLDQILWGKISAILLDSDEFRLPRVRDLAGDLRQGESAIRTLLRRMQRAGKVAEVAQDHYYPRATLGELVEIIIEVSHSQAEGWFTAAQFRDRIGLGRKVAIEILEFFDRVGVTMRRGDLRRPNPHQLGLYRD